MRLLTIFSLMTLTISCVSFKTKSQLEKERATQGLPTQVEQSQKLIAQMTLRMNELESRIQDYTGEVEEIEYRQQKLIPQTQKEIQDKLVDQSKEINSLRSIILKNQQETKQLKRLIESQKGYIQKVSKSLKNLSSQSLVKAKQKKTLKRVSKSDFKQGLKNYSSKRYSSARNELMSALKNEKLNAAQKNQVYQALGHIEFSKRNFDQSNIYFSKIFSKYPKSSMAPDALLHIARAFKGQKNISAAKQAYKTFLDSYPKDKLISKVKSELKKL